MVRRRWLRAALTAAIALASLAAAEPGRIVELDFRGTFSAGAVRDQTAGRFRNDGVEPLPVRSAVASYIMRFETRDARGEPATALAHLFVPEQPVDAGAVLAFAPGSNGLVDACAPSRGYVQGGGLDTYGAYGLAYAGQGLPTVVPNYIGFFDPDRLQPYFVADAEAHVVLDALRAASKALEELDPALAPSHAFAAGFSQGGHVVFAAADRAASYAPDVPLAGVLGFGPSGEVEVVMRAFPYVAPWILVAYADVYDGAIEPAALLREPYASRLMSDVQRLCIAGVQAEYPGDPAALLVPELAASLRAGTLHETHPQLFELVDANRTGVVEHGLPVIILQGVDDPVAPLEDQHRFVRRLCALGSPVRYPNYLRTRHETRYLGFEEALSWIRARVSGETPPSDCDAVPSE
jgi:alpha-beta hydrolase superfamily lysophospholipase